MRVRLLACVAFASLSSLGCKKSEPARSQPDPWAQTATPEPATAPSGAEVAPPPMASKFGASTGGELAKLGSTPLVVGTAPASGRAAPSINVAAITTAGISTMAVRGFAGVQQTGFRVAYAPSNNAMHEQFRAVLQGNRVFETVAEGLNKTVRLPRTIDIQVVDCGAINAFYDPKNSRILVCYELLDYFVGVFKPGAQSDEQLGQAVMGATIFAFYHEAGHALIHQLDLPTVGREEDAVDQLATLILMAAGDDGIGMALSGAYWFQLQQTAGNATPFWDEHSFEGQRFYNILCLIYGSDAQKYDGFVSSGNLPAARAQRCGEEYQKTQRSWEKLLQPHLANDAATEIGYAPSVPAVELDEPSAPPPMPTQPTVEPTEGGDDGDEPAHDDGDGEETPEVGGGVAHQITCEQVAEQAVTLIATEAEKQLAGLDRDELDGKVEELKANLPAFLEQFLATCATENWPDADRRCVLDARTLDQASRCGQ